MIDIFKFPKKTFVSVRILDRDILPIKTHWIKILAGKDKKEVKIPKTCVAFDPNTESNKDGVKCPYCELEGQQTDFKYHINAIIREAQDDKPRKAKEPSKSERKSGFKSPETETWTPVSVLRLPSTLTKKIQELKDLNKKKDKKTGKTVKYAISDPKYGCDIAIKFDPDAKGGDMYQVQMQDRTPLTEEEQEYLVYDLKEELLDESGRETPKAAKEQLARMNIVGADEIDDDDDSGKSKKKKSKSDDDDDDEMDLPVSKKKKSKKDEDEDDADEDEDEDSDSDEDDDEDEKSSKKKKSKKSKSDDDDDDDSSKSKKKSKKSKDDDEEEEDDDDTDEDDDGDTDDDEDEPVKSKKKKSKKDDEDDEDDEDDDEDEDDKKSSKKKSKSKKDDDDDDEPVKKKKGKKSKNLTDDDIPF